MTKMANDDDLLETIEKIRERNFPDLPAALVADIVGIERNYTENRGEAHKRINQAIDAYLSNTVG